MEREDVRRKRGIKRMEDEEREKEIILSSANPLLFPLLPRIGWERKRRRRRRKEERERKRTSRRTRRKSFGPKVKREREWGVLGFCRERERTLFPVEGGAGAGARDRERERERKESECCVGSSQVRREKEEEGRAESESGEAFGGPGIGIPGGVTASYYPWYPAFSTKMFTCLVCVMVPHLQYQNAC